MSSPSLPTACKNRGSLEEESWIEICRQIERGASGVFFSKLSQVRNKQKEWLRKIGGAEEKGRLSFHSLCYWQSMASESSWETLICHMKFMGPGNCCPEKWKGRLAGQRTAEWVTFTSLSGQGLVVFFMGYQDASGGDQASIVLKRPLQESYFLNRELTEHPRTS